MSKDTRNSTCFRLINWLHKSAANLKYVLFERRRFRITPRRTKLSNNYSKTMAGFFSAHSSKAYQAMPYERKLFLQVAKMHIIRKHNQNNRLNGIDFGGGLGYQAVYLQKALGELRTSSIDVLEQLEIVQALKSTNYSAECKDLNISFIHKLPEDGTTYDFSFFNGSLSYIDDPLDFLDQEVFGDLLFISRLPVSGDIDNDLIVYDSFGGHYETIISERRLNRMLRDTNVMLDEQDVLPRSKSKIEGIEVKSRNIIFERS